MRKKSVLMIYPRLPATFWNNDHGIVNFSRQKTVQPPLGLLTVAAILPREYEVGLVDLNTGPLRVEDVRTSDLVFLSAMAIQKDSFDQIVALCNSLGVTVVAGGPYPTACCEEIPGVDHFVLNEAEITLPEFIRDYEKGRPKKVYRTDAKPDITRSPVPRFDLIDPEDYYMLPVQFSRGCPYGCEFCDIISQYGRAFRSKTPEQFLRELDAVFATGYRGELFLVDDNFIGNREKAKALLRRVAEWQKEHDMPFELMTQASLDLAGDDELLDLMVASQFCRVLLGIETPVGTTLEYTGKKHNAGVDLLASVKKVMGRGIMVMGAFIVGFDTDPENIFDLQIDFIRESGIPVAGVGLLKALPGTKLYRRLEKQGRLLGSDSFTGSNDDLSVNFIPRMPKDKLIEGYKKVISTIYRPSNYFQRCYDMLSLYPKGYMTKVHLRKGFLIPYIRSIFAMTFSSFGIHYIRFFWRIARLNTELLRTASLLTVQGYHFFKFTECLLSDDYFYKTREAVSLEASLRA
ncbi:MAG: B12-binding domain-containing radical SAM protein [Spirochaetes bacterium]|nr:B12-binding domain-containing radical SAM protein [Spirochaetota bacterium]